MRSSNDISDIKSGIVEGQNEFQTKKIADITTKFDKSQFDNYFRTILAEYAEAWGIYTGFNKLKTLFIDLPKEEYKDLAINLYFALADSKNLNAVVESLNRAAEAWTRAERSGTKPEDFIRDESIKKLNFEMKTLANDSIKRMETISEGKKKFKALTDLADKETLRFVLLNPQENDLIRIEKEAKGMKENIQKGLSIEEKEALEKLDAHLQDARIKLKYFDPHKKANSDTLWYLYKNKMNLIARNSETVSDESSLFRSLLAQYENRFLQPIGDKPPLLDQFVELANILSKFELEGPLKKVLEKMVDGFPDAFSKEEIEQRGKELVQIQMEREKYPALGELTKEITFKEQDELLHKTALSIIQKAQNKSSFEEQVKEAGNLLADLAVANENNGKLSPAELTKITLAVQKQIEMDFKGPKYTSPPAPSKQESAIQHTGPSPSPSPEPKKSSTGFMKKMMGTFRPKRGGVSTSKMQEQDLMDLTVVIFSQISQNKPLKDKLEEAAILLAELQNRNDISKEQIGYVHRTVLNKIKEDDKRINATEQSPRTSMEKEAFPKRPQQSATTDANAESAKAEVKEHSPRRRRDGISIGSGRGQLPPQASEQSPQPSPEQSPQPSPEQSPQPSPEHSPRIQRRGAVLSRHRPQFNLAAEMSKEMPKKSDEKPKESRETSADQDKVEETTNRRSFGK